MTGKDVYTVSEVKDVFDALRLSPDQSGPNSQIQSMPFESTHSNELIFTRLSDSSNPPPTGRMMDANMERLTG